MESRGITWNRWNHMESHGITWNPMESHGITRNHMESHGITWNGKPTKCMSMLLIMLDPKYFIAWKQPVSFRQLFTSSRINFIILQQSSRFCETRVGVESYHFQPVKLPGNWKRTVTRYLRKERQLLSPKLVHIFFHNIHVFTFKCSVFQLP